jgi:two-component system KDP operon response regulator KdpE
MTRVLVVDDEPQIVRALVINLKARKYEVDAAPDGATALQLAAARHPDVVVLDLGLPDMDGVEVTRRLREWTATPIIVISARGQETDKVEALDAGADDYLTKPFGTSELLARIRVALRHRLRAGEGAETVFRAGELEIDLAARRVSLGDREVRLTRTEYKLLELLVKHAGKVLTHRHMLKEVWGPAAVEQHHYLRVYMGQLRHKLERDPARPRYLVTETGVGYRLKTD